MRTLRIVTYTIPATFKSTSTYHYAVLARKFIPAGCVGLTLVVRTTLFIGAVEDIKVVVISDIAHKDIGDEFQNRGLSNTVSPTRRMVNGIFRQFFNVLMIPFLRGSTSLENIVTTDASEMSL